MGSDVLTVPWSCEVLLGRMGTTGKKLASHLATGRGGVGGATGGPESFIEVLLVIDHVNTGLTCLSSPGFPTWRMNALGKGGKHNAHLLQSPLKKKPL